MASPAITHDSDGDNESDDDEEDDDDEGIAVMIPMADKLNAEYERDNARLFRDYDDGRCVEDRQTTVAKGYTMVTTRDIKAGDQIVRYAGIGRILAENQTFVSSIHMLHPQIPIMSNAHLLDPKILSLLSEDEIGAWPYGNPGDEVQIAGDKIVHAMTSCSAIRNGSANWESSVKHRVDCWLEDGQDEYVFSTGGLHDDSSYNEVLFRFRYRKRSIPQWSPS